MDQLILELNPAKTTQELIKEYCTAVNTRLIWVLAIILLMWLLEPKVKQFFLTHQPTNPSLKNVFNVESLMFLYKFIGLGLIFMVGYGLWIMG